MRKRINKIVVEWDINKEKINIQKHKIDFETAMLAFMDDNKIKYYDHLHSVHEDRYIVIGMVNKVITVICNERRKNIRIISARKANAEERKKYYGKNC